MNRQSRAGHADVQGKPLAVQPRCRSAGPGSQYRTGRETPRPRRCDGHHGFPPGHRLDGMATALAKAKAMRVRKVSAVHVLELRGNANGYLDIDLVQKLTLQLLNLVGPGQRGHVIIDLSRVRSVNTQFLSVVLAAQKRLRDQRRRVALCGLQTHCTDVLQVSGLNPLVECYATERQALETLGSR